MVDKITIDLTKELTQDVESFTDMFSSELLDILEAISVDDPENFDGIVDSIFIIEATLIGCSQIFIQQEIRLDLIGPCNCAVAEVDLRQYGQSASDACIATFYAKVTEAEFSQESYNWHRNQ